MVCQLDCSLIVRSQLGSVLLQHRVQVFNLPLLQLCILVLQLCILLLQVTERAGSGGEGRAEGLRSQSRVNAAMQSSFIYA